jgi:hypothetical protein
MTVNDELERMRKEAAAAQFKTLGGRKTTNASIRIFGLPGENRIRRTFIKSLKANKQNKAIFGIGHRSLYACFM